jgi:beta-phosphoglucomutase-like phosphatase (HAD superfamily)
LILFDIDGTLVWGGPAKDAFQMAMVDTFGTHGDVEGVSFAGKTDPQIVRELLHREGVADDDIDGALPDLWMRYLARLESMLPGRPMRVLAGVTALLDALEATEEAVLGLVTGNIVGGARLKLGSVGLFHRFAVGAFASDHECRHGVHAGPGGHRRGHPQGRGLRPARGNAHRGRGDGPPRC